MQYTNCNNIENARKRWTALLFTTLLSQVTNASAENKKQIYDMTKRVERDVYAFAVKNSHSSECGHSDSFKNETNNRNLMLPKDESFQNVNSIGKGLNGKANNKIINRTRTFTNNQKKQVRGFDTQRSITGSNMGSNMVNDKKVRSLLVAKCNSVLESIYVNLMQEKIDVITKKDQTHKRRSCECEDEETIVPAKKTKVEDKPPVFTIVPKKSRATKIANPLVNLSSSLPSLPQSPLVTILPVTSIDVIGDQKSEITPQVGTPQLAEVTTGDKSENGDKIFNIYTCSGKDHVGDDYGFGCNCDCGYVNCNPCQSYEMWRILASLQPAPKVVEKSWDTNDEAYKLLFG